jgi:sec-independent protein translocase protein TatA
MTPIFAFGLGWPEIMGILVIVLVLFGAKKVPELMKGLGTGIKEFKKASREVQDELHRSVEEDDAAKAHKSVPQPPTSTVAQASQTDAKS